MAELPYAGGRMDDAGLAQALNVGEDHHVLRGVRELLFRVEEALLDDANGLEDRDKRIGALDRFGALEDFRKSLEGWRRAAVERAERGG